MAILETILTAIISILGYPSGLLISYLTKEELKPGKKYFILLENIMLIVAVSIGIYALQFNLYLSIISAIIATIGIAIIQPKPLAGYPIMLITFLISTKNINLLLFTSSAIFIYGLAAASIKK